VVKLKPVLLVASSCCYWALLISATSNHLGLPELLLAANTHHTAQLTAKLTAANANGAHGTRQHGARLLQRAAATRAARSAQWSAAVAMQHAKHAALHAVLRAAQWCLLLVGCWLLVVGATTGHHWCLCLVSLGERVPPATCHLGAWVWVRVWGACRCRWWLRLWLWL
jgi:hypothetical protein